MAFIKFEFAKDKEEKPIEIPVDFSILSKIRLPEKKEKQIIKEKSFVLNWERELGYTGNPFKEELLSPVSDFIAGYEKERDRINLFIINNYKFGAIIGDDGCGKTTLLRWLYEQLGEYKEKIVVRYFRGDRLKGNVSLIRVIVEPMLTLYDKRVEKIGVDVDIDKNTAVLRKKLGNRKLVLLIDDIHDISKENIAALNRMYAVLELQVIGSSAKSYDLSSAEGELKDHLKINLKGISLEEAVSMIKKRIEFFGGRGIEPFDKKHIEKIHKEADSNPKAIINLCQHYAIEASLKWRKKKAELDKNRQAETASPSKSSEETEEYEQEAALKPLEEHERSKEYTIRAVDQGSDSVVIPSGRKKEGYVIKVKKE